MANKRIELEQCKYFVSLFDEYPNRKTVRRGATFLFVVAILLVCAFFVLGMFSNDLAKNPRNVLEPPPEPAPAMPEGMEDMQFSPQTPSDIPSSPSPVEGTPLSPDVPQNMNIPMPGDQGKAPGGAPSALSVAITEPGALLAQAQPETDTAPSTAPPAEGETIEEQPAVDQSAPQQETVQEEKGPGQETSGVGSLAALANWINGRGFQLYLLTLGIALIVVLYLAMRNIRLKGKSK